MKARKRNMVSVKLRGEEEINIINKYVNECIMDNKKSKYAGGGRELLFD